MTFYYSKEQYKPKAIVRTFTDLEIYQKTLEASVIIIKNIRPKIRRLDPTDRDVFFAGRQVIDWHPPKAIAPLL